MFRIDRSTVGSIDKKNPYIMEGNIVRPQKTQPGASDVAREEADIDEEFLTAQTEEEARRKAQDIIAGAQAQAQRIVHEAQGQAEELRQTAWQEAYNKGSDDAEVILKRLREKDVADMRSLADGLEHAKKEIYDGSEMDMLAISVAIARKIVGYELDNAFVYMEFLNNALDKIRFEGKVKLYLDTTSYERFVAQHGENPIVRDTFEITPVENPALAADSAIITYGNESIDLSVDTQIDAIKRELGL